MAEQYKDSGSDEIEMKQLLQLVADGFQKLFKTFLRLFLYFKRNAFIIIGLIVIGAFAGFGLKQFIEEKMVTEIIVRPSTESRDYLYDVIAEIQANIKSDNQEFFDELNISIKDFPGIKIEVQPLGTKQGKLEDELKYLQLLKGLNFSNSVSDIVRNEILIRNSLNQKISISYKKNTDGFKFAKKIMEYINSNPYFTNLTSLYRTNAEKRIEKNTEVIQQLDELIKQYSQNLATKNQYTATSPIVLDNEEQVDIGKLFDLKNNLFADIEAKKVEIQKQTNAIRIINFGSPHELTKPVFSNTVVSIPLFLVGMFFLFSTIKYLNKKSTELL